MTAIFICLTSFLAVVFPNISAVLSILGGWNCVTICYLIPSNTRILIYLAICFVKASEERWFSPYNLMPIAYFGTLILIGYTSVVITVIFII